MSHLLSLDVMAARSGNTRGFEAAAAGEHAGRGGPCRDALHAHGLHDARAVLAGTLGEGHAGVHGVNAAVVGDLWIREAEVEGENGSV
jgi:hypothetical protein